MPIRAARSAPLVSGKACLVLRYAGYGEPDGHRFEIHGDHFLIGRAADADLQVDREAVSRRHARLHLQDGVWHVTDLQSTNGTYVNDEPVETGPIRDGDALRVGIAVFTFLCGKDLSGAYLTEALRLAQTDGLTDVGNRAHLLSTLGREAGRAGRHRRPLSLLRLDIDGFRGIGDRYGALTGDYLLKEAARRLREVLRPDDALARASEEGFALVLPETGEEEAAQLGKQVQEALCGATYDFGDDRIAVTVTLGAKTREEEEGEALLAAAEAALQHARRSAGSRLVSGSI